MRNLIVGQAVLVVIDMQKDGGMPVDVSGIPVMAGFKDRVEKTMPLVEAAREAGVPVIFFQEAHRPDHVDFRP